MYLDSHFGDYKLIKKYFGTDGIRGRVGESPITPEIMLHLGYSAGKVFAAADWHLMASERPTVLIGKDTRVSAPGFLGRLRALRMCLSPLTPRC